MCVGGTHTLSHAMEGACRREGVAMRENSHVREIIVKGGRAVGVELEDGTKFEARKLVASNADLRQTLFDMVGKENLSAQWIKRTNDFRIGPDHCLGTTAFALKEAPDYKSAKWDPNINKTFYTVVGYETPDDMINYIRQAMQGKVPDLPGAGTWVNSLWDPTQAPAGKHSMTGWFFFPKASELTPAEWDDVRANYNEKFLAHWEKYAPNMTRDNVLADVLYTPLDQEQKMLMREGCFSNGSIAADQAGWMRPFPEASQYRTEIEGLYLCGPYTHPSGGVFAACGYNAFKSIVNDYDLPKLWEQTDRGY
jgi:phytoene dehydrogenase-like protein